MSEGSNLFGLKPKAKRKRLPAAPDGSVHKLIMLWSGLFTQRFGERPVITPRDGKVIKDLVRQYDESIVAKRLEQYVNLGDAYLEDAGYPISLLPGVWNRLVAQGAPHRHTNRAPSAEDTSAYLRSLRRK